MKRWCYRIALCLCVCLLTLGLCGRMEAAEVVDSGTCGESLTWSLDGDGVLTIRGTGEMADYQPWAGNRWKIESVVVEPGVTSIGEQAFYYCRALTSITLPNSVRSIGEWAFYDCRSLQTITIPQGVTSIGYRAFDGCSGLTNVTIPDGVTSIGETAFYSCSSLQQITLPDSLTSLGRSVFSHCSSLERIVIPARVTGIPIATFCGCTNLKSVTLPDDIDWIGEDAFRDCVNLEQITLPDGLWVINNSVFQGCSSLMEIRIPDKLGEIGKSAFQGCSSLKSIELPDSVTSIGASAFQDCSSLQRVTLSRSREIGESAFEGCGQLQRIIIPDQVTSIGPYAFYNCKALKAAGFAGDAPELGTRAFWMDGEAAAVSAIPGLALSYIAGKENWTTPSYSGYPTNLWDCKVFSHWYLDTVTEPTCTAEGYTAHTCAACGDTYRDSYVARTEHNYYTAEVCSASCTEEGYVLMVCSSCGDRYRDQIVPALGHQYANGFCIRCGAQDSSQFSDVSANAWYASAVQYAVEHGLMAGVGNNRFGPEEPMTRAMLVTVLWRYAGRPEAGKNPFTDVPAGQWYTEAVTWAAENGVVSGVGNGRFAPNGNITREQMASILFRYAKLTGLDTSKRGELAGFPDEGQVSSWAREALSWAVGEGIISGTAEGGRTILKPQGNATRAQVASILMRFIRNSEKA